eukprot:227243-Chlamydomonas_euryale.AAC.3
MHACILGRHRADAGCIATWLQHACPRGCPRVPRTLNASCDGFPRACPQVPHASNAACPQDCCARHPTRTMCRAQLTHACAASTACYTVVGGHARRRLAHVLAAAPARTIGAAAMSSLVVVSMATVEVVVMASSVVVTNASV